MEASATVKERRTISVAMRAIPKLLQASRSGCSAIVSAATGNGKSIVVQPSILETALAGRRKVLYVCPLKTIVQQVVRTFEDIAEKSYARMKVFAYTSESTSPMPPAGGAAQFSSQLLKGISLAISLLESHRKLSEIGYVVVDEAHNIGRESSRAHAWQTLLAIFRHFSPNTGIVCLSATLFGGLRENLASYLEVKSEFIIRQHERRIPLKHFCLIEKSGNLFQVTKGTSIQRVEGYSAQGWTSHVKCSKGNSIIFCSSKAQTRNLALQLSAALSKDEGEEAGPPSDALRLAAAQSSDETLAKVMLTGVAFHNGELSQADRELVEEMFKERHVRIIVATTTLSEGVNLPTRSVYLRSISFFGGSPIEPGRFLQMIGRAGRPGMDPAGDAVVVLRSNKELSAYSRLLRTAQNADSETSSLYCPYAQDQRELLRVLLTAISLGVDTSSKLHRFFSTATMMPLAMDTEKVEIVVDEAIKELRSLRMTCVKSEKIALSRLGKACARSFLFPAEACTVFNELSQAHKTGLVLESEGLHLLFLAVRDATLPLPLLGAHAALKALAFVLKKARWMQDISFRILARGSSNHAADWESAEWRDEYFQRRLSHLSRFGGKLKDSERRLIVAICMCEFTRESSGLLTRALGLRQGQIEAISKIVARNAAILSIFCAEVSWVYASASFKVAAKRLAYGCGADLAECDLLELRGVGPSRARILLRAGIVSVADLNATDASDVSEALKAALQSLPKGKRKAEVDRIKRAAARIVRRRLNDLA